MLQNKQVFDESYSELQLLDSDEEIGMVSYIETPENPTKS
jgi:hypothetical protein